MFDIGRDRNIYFSLGMLQTYSELEDDPKKKSVLAKIMSDILGNYNAIILPIINELNKEVEEAEDEN